MRAPGTSTSLEIFPEAVTVEIGQPVQFRQQSRGPQVGTSAAIRLAWTASGGSINPSGTFSSSKSGTFKVIGRGRGWRQLDSAVVIVVAPQPHLARLAVAPDPATVEAGGTHTFSATGYLADGSVAPVGVTWSATGGNVDPAGLYTADNTTGTFRVIAANTAGSLADTAEVVVVHRGEAPAPTPSPTPPTAPAAPNLARVFVTPGRITLVAGAARQYMSFGRTGSGDSVAVSVTFSATGGKVTSGGLYTAGSTPGKFKIVAKEKSTGLADTTGVTVAAAVPVTGPTTPPVAPTPLPGPINPPPDPTPPPAGARTGVPFGPFNLFGPNASGGLSGSGPFSLTMDAYSASNIVSRINQARASGTRLMIAMASGSHANYKTNGAFDMSKWQYKMDSYNTPAIRAAVAAAVADGTILGNEVMDEPHNTYGANSWGPAGTMTKSRVDQMCGYVKRIFPTLPAGVTHDQSAFEPGNSYASCDFVLAQYAYRKTKGDITKFRDDALAMGRRDGIAIAFSLNVLDGGITQTGCPVGMTGGPGIMYSAVGACRMTAAQIREFGQTLGTAGCALLMWRYDADFFSRPENIQAFKDIAATLARSPARPCTRR